MKINKFMRNFHNLYKKLSEQKHVYVNFYME